MQAEADRSPDPHALSLCFGRLGGVDVAMRRTFYVRSGAVEAEHGGAALERCHVHLRVLRGRCICAGQLRRCHCGPPLFDLFRTLTRPVRLSKSEP